MKHDSISAHLSSMEVGESRLFVEWTRPQKMTALIKRYARIRLDRPDAQWQGRTTNHGVRVTRIR